MRVADYGRAVRHTLSSNRMRAFLTLLGTIIGAASIVLLAGLLRSGEELLVSATQRASESDIIVAEPDLPPFALYPKTHHELNRHDQDTVEGDGLFEGARTSGSSMREVPAESLGDHGEHMAPPGEYRVRAQSVEADATKFYRLNVVQGRGISEEDILERRRACVVGSLVWEHFFGENTKLTNQRLRVENHDWPIIGVLESKPTMFGGNSTWHWNRRMLVPRTTFDAMFRADHTVDRMYVRLQGSPDLVARSKLIEKMLHAVLRRTHNVDNVAVKSQNSSEGQERLILAIIKALLLSTALLSLFVGGINIMNIMLVTVTERTREIGLRRALGATPQNISLQFLLESVLIAGVGGVMGILVGVGLTWGASQLLAKVAGAFAFHVELWSVVLGLGLSVLTGVAFGLFPAIRASRLDPVEALRFE
jgi:putative ABC transport system permease protein